MTFNEILTQPFDKVPLSIVDAFRPSGNVLISFVVSLSNHDRNQLDQRFFVKNAPAAWHPTTHSTGCSSSKPLSEPMRLVTHDRIMAGYNDNIIFV